jgi:putative Mn2+ efflux pump MntP
MVLLTIVIIAIGLAMDAFAVSIVSGAAYKKLNIRHAFRLALFFGGFQAYDHWVAFALLTAVGAKMLYESTKIKPAHENSEPMNLLVLLALSVATSIDALAVGITLSLLRISIAMAAIIIGLVTFVLSYIGVFIGKNSGHFFENKIEALGGLILIAIGLKILFEHLF